MWMQTKDKKENMSQILEGIQRWSMKGKVGRETMIDIKAGYENTVEALIWKINDKQIEM